MRLLSRSISGKSLRALRNGKTDLEVFEKERRVFTIRSTSCDEDTKSNETVVSINWEQDTWQIERQRTLGKDDYNVYISGESVLSASNYFPFHHASILTNSGKTYTWKGIARQTTVVNSSDITVLTTKPVSLLNWSEIHLRTTTNDDEYLAPLVALTVYLTLADW